MATTQQTTQSQLGSTPSASTTVTLGEIIDVVESGSTPGTFYIVRLNRKTRKGSCTCADWTFRHQHTGGRCYHMECVLAAALEEGLIYGVEGRKQRAIKCNQRRELAKVWKRRRDGEVNVSAHRQREINREDEFMRQWELDDWAEGFDPDFGGKHSQEGF